uniref:DUF3456 domain-containing protein n=1 Tax=Caenorhabditis tropicalis TaxID=1561998 RepID=A0A1I7TLI7_9PELO
MLYQNIENFQVELGMPFEMWDQPSAEIVALRQSCESLLEEYEEIIEEWFFEKTDSEDLFKKLCVQNAIKNGDINCFEKPYHSTEL